VAGCFYTSNAELCRVAEDAFHTVTPQILVTHFTEDMECLQLVCPASGYTCRFAGSVAKKYIDD
jgi:hypothetical protein